MAIRFVYSVYDSKAEAYLQPFFCTTRAVAVRSFTAAVRQEGHEFQKFAEDYTLFELGTFDDGKGEFDLFLTPQSVVKAAAVAAMEGR